jgi:hypothetical protein
MLRLAHQFAIWVALSIVIGRMNVAAAFPKDGDVPASQCVTAFKRFGLIRLPADASAVSRALKDSRWLSRATVDQIIFLAGWIPIEHSPRPPGSVFTIVLRPAVSQKNAGYRIYLHTTRIFSGDAAMGLRAFLAGHATPGMFIDEYALCYPDGRILHINGKSRRMIPSLFF